MNRSMERQINAVQGVESAVGRMAKNMSAEMSSTVISVDRVNDSVQTVTRQMSGVESALGALAGSIDAGFADLSYQLRLQSGQLSQILEVLQAPLDTQSKELRKRAQDAYQNGWLEEAEEDFLSSRELNRYDFTIHQALGNIKFYHRHDPKTAIAHFECASKYSRPKSPFDCALAELSLATVASSLNLNGDALSHAKQALNVAPNLPEANYATARYMTKEGIVDNQIEELLLVAFKGRLVLCMLAISDDDLRPARTQVKKALDRYHSELRDEIKELLLKFEHAINIAERVTSQMSGEIVAGAVDETKSQFRAIRALAKTGSIVDLYSAIAQLKVDFPSFIQKATNAIAEARRAVGIADSQRNALKATIGRFTGGILGIIFIGGGAFGGLAAGVSGFIASAQNPGFGMMLMFFLMLGSPFIGGWLGFMLGQGIGDAVGTATSSQSTLQAYESASSELNAILR